MENKELECIEEIIKIIEKYGFEFPEPIKKLGLENGLRGRRTPLQTIRRVFGILKNANEENSKEKLDSLLKFLSVFKNQK